MPSTPRLFPVTRAWRAGRALAVATLLWLAGPWAVAQQAACGAVQENGVRQCRVSLDAEQVRQMPQTQERSQWCWAASIAMVFAHQGFVLPQAQIVQRHFGREEDRAITAEAIAALLSQPWRDAQGRHFQVLAESRVAPQEPPRHALLAAVHELAHGRPLVMGALRHAMVLVALEYEHFVAHDAVRITGGTVVDPMPGRGVRALTPPELRPTFLASVRLEPAAAPQALAALTLQD